MYPVPEATWSWLRLTLTPGVSFCTQKALAEVYGSAGSVLAANPAELAAGIGAAGAAALARGPDARLLERTARWLESPGHEVVTWADARYPRRLREIGDAPLVLYAKGRLELLDAPSVAIVGSRNATPQGMQDARQFAQALSECGLTIVSGLALGIDAAAHRGGLAARGSSVAVVGTGLDTVYPRANEPLARELGEKGCLLSEFPVGTPPYAGNFPERNRLISGLSLGVLVVEAGERSGSLATASRAAKQNREVFAVPGSIHSAVSKGCHRLLRDGATLVECVDDVLAQLRWRERAASASPRVPRARVDALLEAMGFGPISIDEMAAHTGLSASELLVAMSRYELEGLVCALPGGKYQRAAA